MNIVLIFDNFTYFFHIYFILDRSNNNRIVVVQQNLSWADVTLILQSYCPIFDVKSITHVTEPYDRKTANYKTLVRQLTNYVLESESSSTVMPLARASPASESVRHHHPSFPDAHRNNHNTLLHWPRIAMRNGILTTHVHVILDVIRPQYCCNEFLVWLLKQET